MALNWRDYDAPTLTPVIINDSNPIVRRMAFQNLLRTRPDDENLAKIALQAPEADHRLAAAERIKDQKLLAKIALESTDPDVALAVLYPLRDQAALETIARKSLYFKRAIAVQGLSTSSPYLKEVASETNPSTARAFARLKFIVQDPVIVKRCGKVRSYAITDKISNDYGEYIGSEGLHYIVEGASVTLQVRRDDTILASQSWRTRFPRKVAEPPGSFRGRGFIDANVDITSLLVLLLRQETFSLDELNAIVASEAYAELREAAQQCL